MSTPGGGAEPSSTKGSNTAPSGGNSRHHQLALKPLTPNDIPPHPSLKQSQPSPPSLAAFLNDLFADARASDLSSFAPNGTFRGSVDVNGTPHTLDVQKLKQQVGGKEGIWFARRSLHPEKEAAAGGGIVSYAELDACLRVKHEQHEGEYTPNIFDVHTLLEWDRRDEEMRRAGEGVVGVRDVEMRITQMFHSMPWPLKARVFSVLVLSGVRSAGEGAGAEESVIMQLPMDMDTFPAQQLGSRAHPGLRYSPPSAGSASPEQRKNEGKKLVEGVYVSLETITRLTEGEGGKRVNRWDMKTASDAGGWLPKVVQNLGVPGAICKDVPFGIGWIVARRGG